VSLTLQWALTTKRFGYHIYELAKDNLQLLSLAFDPATQTARVDCNETKRAFRIEKQGFFKRRIVLKNEYGVNLGELSYEKPGANQGFIDMNGERFFFGLRDNNQQELVIYKSTSEEPILSCNLSYDKQQGEQLKQPLTEVYSHLLMALGWFLFLPVAKEKLLFG